MPEIAPDKVAIYIRWSTEDQGEGTTLEVQLQGCRHYLLSQGWQVREDLIFIDDGHSGATLERPALGRLRRAVGDGGVACVVVYKLDRLSRSVADTARLCMDEWDGICWVKSAREPIDTTSQAGRMFFYTLMNYAEWERSVIRDRTHSGRLRRAQEGRSPGITLPYGYEGAFTVVPEEAEVVRGIFAAYRSGLGVLAIVADLNRRGVRFRNGRPWQHNTVAYLLANPAYVGDLVWGRRMLNPRSRRRPDEPRRQVREQPLVCRAGVYPPLVSRAEFDLVQAIRAGRPGVKRGGGGGRSVGSPYLLTGLLRCARCGAPLAGKQNSPGSAGGRYYVCTAGRQQGPEACDARSIACAALDARVVERLLALHDPAQTRARALAVVVAEAARRAASARAELAEVERRLARLSERDRRIGRDYSAELLTAAEFRQLRTDLAAEGQALASARADLALRTQTARAEPAAAQTALSALDPWAILTTAERKELLRNLVASVIVARCAGAETVCEVIWRAPA